jgi:hypothetical protein
MKNLEPGPIEETTHHERLLSEVWDDLGGDEGGMTGQKLVGRMKHIEWHPPVLSFSIERHGGTVLGSTRAEVQQWCVDIDRQIASCESTGHRQLSPMARRVDVDSIAEQIAGRIANGEADDRLSWLGDGPVRVEVGKIFPDGSGYKQTFQGRRKRLREALLARLGTMGWNHVRRNTFERMTLPPASH